LPVFSVARKGLVTAAMPVRKQTACGVPWSAAIAGWSASTVGFETGE